MNQPAFIYDYIRTPIGRFGGAISSVRADASLTRNFRRCLSRQHKRRSNRSRAPFGHVGRAHYGDGGLRAQTQGFESSDCNHVYDRRPGITILLEAVYYDEFLRR